MCNVAASLGYFGSTLSDQVQIVTEMVPGLMLPLMIFGGLVLPIDAIPGYIKWAVWLSWFPFSHEIILTSQFKVILNRNLLLFRTIRIFAKFFMAGIQTCMSNRG